MYITYLKVMRTFYIDQSYICEKKKSFFKPKRYVYLCNSFYPDVVLALRSDGKKFSHIYELEKYNRHLLGVGLDFKLIHDDRVFYITPNIKTSNPSPELVETMLHSQDIKKLVKSRLDEIGV